MCYIYISISSTYFYHQIKTKKYIHNNLQHQDMSSYAKFFAVIVLSNLALFSIIAESIRVVPTHHMQSKIVANVTTEKASTTQWGSSCPHVQIQISQGSEAMKGIPRFTVLITNLCNTCSISQVHVHCGMFASANVVNPNLFKRIAVDDCLVNGGKPIASGRTIEFQYSNTFPYPMKVASFLCSK